MKAGVATTGTVAGRLGDALRQPRVRANALLFFLYTGAEASAGQWAFSLLTESRGMPAAAAGLAASTYWGSIFVGRLAFGAVAHHVAPPTLLRLGMAGAPLAALVVCADARRGGRLRGPLRPRPPARPDLPAADRGDAGARRRAPRRPRHRLPDLGGDARRRRAARARRPPRAPRGARVPGPLPPGRDPRPPRAPRARRAPLTGRGREERVLSSRPLLHVPRSHGSKHPCRFAGHRDASRHDRLRRRDAGPPRSGRPPLAASRRRSRHGPPRPEPVGRRRRPRRARRGPASGRARRGSGRRGAAVGPQPDLPRRLRGPDHGAPARGLPARPHRGGHGRAHPRAGEDDPRHLRLRHRRGGRPPGRRGHAGPPARRTRRPPRRRHAAGALLAAAGDAAPRGRAARRGPPFPGLPGVRRRGPPRRDRPRPDPLRGAGARDQRPGRHHGRRREGGAALDPLVAQPPLPSPVAAAQPAHRLRRRRRRRGLSGHDRQARRPGGVPAGAGRPVRQHRLPGPRGHAARSDSRRAAPRRSAGGSSSRRASSAS